MSQPEQLELNFPGSTHVRFSAQEYRKVQKDSKDLSKSVPTLLKEAYFKRLPTKVLVKNDDLVTLRKDLNRIGNNLNQVARKLNSGFMAGWSDTLDDVLNEFQKLNNLIHMGHGVQQSSMA